MVVSVAPPRTLPGQALLVIDMQNAFCHPRGSFARMGYDVTGCVAAVAGCVRIVEGARRHGVPVLFVTYGYQPDYCDGGYLVASIHPEVVTHQALVRGTWDVEVVDELAAAPGEPHVVKNRYSAFVGTDVAERLRRMAVTAVTVCGVTTNVCVEGTARDAAQIDLSVTVVRDACGEIDPSRHVASLATIEHALGRVVAVDDVVAEWADAADRGLQERTTP